jgi:hypothetical protein
MYLLAEPMCVGTDRCTDSNTLYEVNVLRLMSLNNCGKIYFAYPNIDWNKGSDCQYSFGCHYDNVDFTC